MKTRTHARPPNRTASLIALLLAAGALSLSGCHRNIVRAAPPSVVRSTPNRTHASAGASRTAGIRTRVRTRTRPGTGSLSRHRTARARASATGRRRSTQPKPESEPPQISPELSPRDQADAMRNTNDDIRTAEKNLQAANGKKLNASQTDLVGKVQGFLSQAREAIRANDWVRARNLALKAEVLSTELIKSF